jgi:hypothetical protein
MNNTSINLRALDIEGVELARRGEHLLEVKEFPPVDRGRWTTVAADVRNGCTADRSRAAIT